MKKPNEPVMHCTAKQTVQVYILAGRVLNEGVYFNTSVFLDPTVLPALFTAAYTKFGVLVGQAKGDKKATKQRNDQSVLVYGLLLQLLLYVKQLAAGDAAIINLSGFDLNDQPEKTVAPETPVIKSVKEGKVGGTYKVLLTRKQAKVLLAKKANATNGHARFSVQTSATPTTESSWNTVLDAAASSKLIFGGLISGVKIYIRVYATNVAGRSAASAPFPFIPQ
jgi:hypothetical protein